MSDEATNDDRRRRLTRRAEHFFARLQGVSYRHQELLESAWNTAAVDPAAKPAALETLLALAEHVVASAQRLDGLGEWHARAETVLLDAAAHAEATLRVALLPPMLVVEPIDSPLFLEHAVGAPSWVSGSGVAELPLPIVVGSGALLEEPWGWAGLLHELGHHLDALRKDHRAVHIAALDRKDPALMQWEPWLPEVVADVYAGLLGGPGIPAALATLLSDASRTNSHPPGPARSSLVAAVLSGLGGRVAAQPVAVAIPEGLVAILVARFRHWGSAVAADAAATDDTRPRLVPAAAHALRASGADADAARASTHAWLVAAPAPSFQLTDARRETLRGAMRHLVETVRVGPSGLKQPPSKLFAAHDRIAFVGATHHQLAASLREAAALRGRPWDRVELFALADAPLQRLTLSGTTGVALSDERDAALELLRAFLANPAACAEYTIRLHDDPYLFASLCDAEDNESRPRSAEPAHIHASAALWGQDLRYASSDDYEAPAGAPLPARMQQYVQALRALRTLSQPWAPPGRGVAAASQGHEHSTRTSGG